MTGLVGRTLAGRYDVLERVGAGGMGEVYRARDRELDELVALKVIRSDVVDPDAIERFRNEIKLARRVTHQNVARTFELGWADGLMFCTMELVDGESLADRLARERRLAHADAVAIACALCDGLATAHAANVIHRDIKPANVLIAGTGRVVLADFGIAAAAAGAAGDDDGDTAGTPAYMAPEQARGEPPTPAADVYAVGVLLYEMLVGQRAFAGSAAKVATDKQEVEHLAIRASDIPPELANVVGRATARRREDRVATAAALRQALAPWATAGSAMKLPPLHAVPARHERAVVVIAPSGDHDLMYAVEALHEELLAALARSGRLRVVPRAEPGATGSDVVVRFEVTNNTLAVIVARGDAATAAPAALHVPIATRDIPRAVALAVRLVEGLLEPAPTRDEAYDLTAQARHIARRRSFVDAPRALVERAHELAPADPLVNANHAILLVRAAFFANTIDPTLIPRATEHVRFALATGPHLAESHLAAAHLELHTGEAANAAAHYRAAIACTPHSAEPHDHLGRMLLEAGYLAAGFARLAHATAISPSFVDSLWQIARAHVLEDRWELAADMFDPARPPGNGVLSLRLASWRRDRELLASLRIRFDALKLQPRIASLLFAVFLDDRWDATRDELFGLLEPPSPSRRRRSFIAQIIAEAAGHAGDIASCHSALALSAGHGLFDRHWLEKCPLLASVRNTPELQPIRAQVTARAHAIHDALYGDHAIGHGETVLATS